MRTDTRAGGSAVVRTSGRSLVSAVLIAVALVLFAPVFADAAGLAGYRYGAQLELLFGTAAPVLLAAGGAAVLLLAATRWL
jgi:hypothetical protein